MAWERDYIYAINRLKLYTSGSLVYQARPPSLALVSRARLSHGESLAHETTLARQKLGEELRKGPNPASKRRWSSLIDSLVP